MRLARSSPVAVEVAGLLLWFFVFTRLQAAAGRDVVAATANALALQRAERAAHLDIELSLNRWLAGQVVLSHLAVYFYRLYYVVVAGVLLWVGLRHADFYRRARRTLVAMTVLVLPVYWAVPMSPPRFAQPGVTDIVARYDIVGHASASHYTAMPSLHVGWALWCAYAAWSVLRVTRPRLAPLPWVFPLLMVADVLATGNHYLLDVVGSAVLVGAAVVTASMWGRRGRPAYRPVPASPPR